MNAARARAWMPAGAGALEAPLLVNALKLDAHVPLYGAPELLDSYTYSPLLDLEHHAVLSPFGAELSLFAGRAIVLFEQGAAIAVFASIAVRHVRGAIARA